MGQVANAAHEEQPANRYQLQRTCLEVLKLCVNIKGIREHLSWALVGDSANAIKSYRLVLLSEVERIEGAAAREAQAKGWDLNVFKGLVQGILESTRYTLRNADRALCNLKAGHHAARVEDLAGEASEVLHGTRCWSRQDCTEFRKELDWELQTFSKANTKLELYRMLWDEKRAAHLRAEKVEAAAHHAERAMERVLWDPRLRMGGAPETQAGSSSAHPPGGEL
jgi:hypothetical protein